MISIKSSLSFSLLLVMFGCATAPPPTELLDARKAYERASKSLATQLAPAELDTAQQALAKAEKSYEEEGAGEPTQDLAYVAERKAQIAEITGAKVAADRDSKQADKQFKDAQLEGLDKTKQELKSEKKARAEAEKKAAAAMASLAEMAKVTEEDRGMVITLSGSVLFKTAKYDLLPIAREKLNEVATALSGQNYKAIIVEGHTDSQGRAADNDTLSLKRAESVRTYLISQGIPSDKISAKGLGSSRSIDDNSTPDGRANNRRVEIVVQPNK